MLELVFIGIILLGLGQLHLAYRVGTIGSAVQSSQSVDPKSLQRSVKDTVKTQIAQSFNAPLDVSAFIEHTLKQLASKKGVEVHSDMEYKIVLYIASEVYGEGFVDAKDQYELDKNTRDLRCKSTVFKILTQEKVS
jgi:hypothetical protein